MRHRKGSFEQTSNQPKPLAFAVLDLCNEFLMSHMMKNLPVELCGQILAILHRILCFEKKFRIRLDYHWSKTWDTLHTFLRFLITSETTLALTGDLFALSFKVYDCGNPLGRPTRRINRLIRSINSYKINLSIFEFFGKFQN